MRQFARFSTVGLGNAGISLCVDALLLAVGLPDVPASAAAFGAGALNGYLFNRLWTFDARDSTRTRIAYLVVQIGGLAATVALVSAQRAATHAPGLVVYIAAACPVTVGMFVANRSWTFGARRAREPALAEGARRPHPCQDVADFPSSADDAALRSSSRTSSPGT